MGEYVGCCTSCSELRILRPLRNRHSPLHSRGLTRSSNSRGRSSEPGSSSLYWLQLPSHLPEDRGFRVPVIELGTQLIEFAAKKLLAARIRNEAAERPGNLKYIRVTQQ